ncbi:hypothetical protein [Mariniphaga sediminis]|jgi:hypothetical protein|uniref:hypothetical protein n=1 Tax=Mariniphaga sediminis TaxID=1628158 RepID=UPI0035655129
MKSKKLKILFLALFLLPLCLLLLGAGCEKDERDSFCYQGKVITLNLGDGCPNIIKITEPVENGNLVKNATISFNPDLYEGTLKVGDVVLFKVLEYEQWVGPATANCLWPEFTGQIEFCNK